MAGLLTETEYEEQKREVQQQDKDARLEDALLERLLKLKQAQGRGLLTAADYELQKARIMEHSSPLPSPRQSPLHSLQNSLQSSLPLLSRRSSVQDGGGLRICGESQQQSQHQRLAEEMRIDPADGQQHTKQYFIDAYGGLVQWDRAGQLGQIKQQQQRLQEGNNQPRPVLGAVGLLDQTEELAGGKEQQRHEHAQPAVQSTPVAPLAAARAEPNWDRATDDEVDASLRRLEQMREEIKDTQHISQQPNQPADPCSVPHKRSGDPLPSCEQEHDSAKGAAAILPLGYEYHIYILHCQGRGRAAKVNDELVKAGFRTCFSISWRSLKIDDVTKDVKKSLLVLIMITQDFLVNVAGQGPGAANNTCKKAFEHAVEQRGIGNMLPVVIEERYCYPWDWQGPVGNLLGEQTNFNLSSDDSVSVLKEGKYVRDGMQRLIREATTRIAAISAASPSDVSQSSQKLSGDPDTSVVAPQGGWREGKITTKVCRLRRGQPWGLVLDEGTLHVCDFAAGSVAAELPILRKYIGLELASIDGRPVRNLADVERQLERCDRSPRSGNFGSARLCFREPLPHGQQQINKSKLPGAEKELQNTDASSQKKEQEEDPQPQQIVNEMRNDPADGQQHTRQHSIDSYGGLVQWEWAGQLSRIEQQRQQEHKQQPQPVSGAVGLLDKFGQLAAGMEQQDTSMRTQQDTRQSAVECGAGKAPGRTPGVIEL